MGTVTSLDDWKLKKAVKKIANKAEKRSCPKCKAPMFPGVESNEQVWVCLNCTTIVWTQ